MPDQFCVGFFPLGMMGLGWVGEELHVAAQAEGEKQSVLASP